MSREHEYLTREILCTEPVQGIQTRREVMPEVDIQNRQCGTQGLVRVLLKFGKTGIAMARQTKFGIQEKREQRRQIAVVVQYKNAARGWMRDGFLCCYLITKFSDFCEKFKPIDSRLRSGGKSL